MRSRYSAFALGLAPYLLMTWHPETRPGELVLSADQQWIRLEVISAPPVGPGENCGTVSFRAVYRIGGRAHTLTECSRFERIDARWFYREGIIDAGTPGATVIA